MHYEFKTRANSGAGCGLLIPTASTARIFTLVTVAARAKSAVVCLDLKCEKGSGGRMAANDALKEIAILANRTPIISYDLHTDGTADVIANCRQVKLS